MTARIAPDQLVETLKVASSGYDDTKLRSARNAIERALREAYNEADQADAIRDLMKAQAHTVAGLEFLVARLEETINLKQMAAPIDPAGILEARVLNLIDELDDGRANGTIFTYGQIQVRLREMVGPVAEPEMPVDPVKRGGRVR